MNAYEVLSADIYSNSNNYGDAYLFVAIDYGDVKQHATPVLTVFGRSNHPVFVFDMVPYHEHVFKY